MQVTSNSPLCSRIHTHTRYVVTFPLLPPHLPPHLRQHSTTRQPHFQEFQLKNKIIERRNFSCLVGISGNPLIILLDLDLQYQYQQTVAHCNRNQLKLLNLHEHHKHCTKYNPILGVTSILYILLYNTIIMCIS
jgi:hypothetical protein